MITGVLDSIERDDAVDLVQRYGGKVTSAISKKTSFLVVGRDPGETKTKKVRSGVYSTKLCRCVIFCCMQKKNSIKRKTAQRFSN